MLIYRHDTNETGSLSLKLFKNGSSINDIAEDMIRGYYHTGDERISFNKELGIFECSEEHYHYIDSLFYHIEFLNKEFDDLNWEPDQIERFMCQFDQLDLWEAYYAAVQAMCKFL